MQDTDAEITALLNKHAGLDQLNKRLKAIGGINKQIAMESVDLVPDLVTNACPLAFYSQDISKTRYNVSLESIGTEIKTVVKKIIAKIKEYIAAAINWIRLLYKKIESSQAMHYYRKLDQKLTVIERDYGNLQSKLSKPESLAGSILKAAKNSKGEPSSAAQMHVNVACKKFVDDIKNIRARFCATKFGAITVSKTDLIFEDVVNAKQRNKRLFNAVRDSLKDLSKNPTSKELLEKLISSAKKIDNRFDSNIGDYIATLQASIDKAETLSAEQSDKVPLNFMGLRFIEVVRAAGYDAAEADMAANELEILMKDSISILEKAKTDENASTINEVGRMIQQCCGLSLWAHRNTASLLREVVIVTNEIDECVNSFATKIVEHVGIPTMRVLGIIYG